MSDSQGKSFWKSSSKEPFIQPAVSTFGIHFWGTIKTNSFSFKVIALADGSTASFWSCTCGFSPAQGSPTLQGRSTEQLSLAVQNGHHQLLASYFPCSLLPQCSMPSWNDYSHFLHFHHSKCFILKVQLNAFSSRKDCLVIPKGHIHTSIHTHMYTPIHPYTSMCVCMYVYIFPSLKSYNTAWSFSLLLFQFFFYYLLITIQVCPTFWYRDMPLSSTNVSGWIQSHPWQAWAWGLQAGHLGGRSVNVLASSTGTLSSLKAGARANSSLKPAIFIFFALELFIRWLMALKLCKKAGSFYTAKDLDGLERWLGRLIAHFASMRTRVQISKTHVKSWMWSRVPETPAIKRGAESGELLGYQSSARFSERPPQRSKGEW